MTVDVEQFAILDTPPSLNMVGSRQDWRAFHRHKKQWQGDIETWLMVRQLPKDLDRVRVYASMRFPTTRTRDRGNFQALLEKSLGDALVNGGWLADDSPDHYAFEDLRFEDDRGPKRTTINLVYERSAEA